MPRLEIACEECGAYYTPTRAEIMAGPAVYQLCPAFRPPAAGDQIEQPDGQSHSA